MGGHGNTSAGGGGNGTGDEGELTGVDAQPDKHNKIIIYFMQTFV